MQYALQYPRTRLGKLVLAEQTSEILSLCDEFQPGNKPEFFFDRNPEHFASVLEMFRSGSRPTLTSIAVLQYLSFFYRPKPFYFCVEWKIIF